MRLLHTTDLTFEEFFESEVPPYAILSHRWISGQEISYEDFTLERYNDRNGNEKSGWRKIVWFARLAKQEYGCEWCWIDTCCIDKKSSAELSEAINSMFKWYRNARACVAYLFDVDTTKGDKLSQSEWFARGWTLQELLAPKEVWFYDANCTLVGTKTARCCELSAITGISERSLIRLRSIFLASVAERMSWAARRQTTRVEDAAYCLFGLFNVRLPLLYGEGNQAFVRLQQEIIRQSDDESIFAWTDDSVKAGETDGMVCSTGMLAKSPRAFIHGRNILEVSISRAGAIQRPPYYITNKGLEIQVPFPGTIIVSDFLPFRFLRLNCYLNATMRDRQWQPVEGEQIHILLVGTGHNKWERVALPFHVGCMESSISSHGYGKDGQFEVIRVREPSLFGLPAVLRLSRTQDVSFVEFDLNSKDAVAEIGLSRLKRS